MELAREACRKQQTCEEDQCNKENISPINDITQNNSNALDHIILNNELSPDDFSKLIDQAEIVFDKKDLLNISRVKHLGDNNNFGEIVLNRGYGFNDITNELTDPNVSTSFCSINGTTLLSSMEADPDFSAETTSENEHFDSEWYSSEENEESGQTVVFTDNQDDSGLNDVDENAKQNNIIEATEKQKKLKKIKGINKRTINEQLRMQGGEYLVFTKPRAQKNTFHNKNRPDRKLGNRCDCNSKSKTLSCSALSETSGQTIFNQFWTELNWDQRKIYVANSVNRISPKNRE
ncbi:hypothetical protein JTB14_011566 [Gonioctena quinquepunctata]|nr:hypothetical protein JTB14_011566 [Gonioctena quinquepunctata]